MVNPRLAWDASFQVPSPESGALGNIHYDHPARPEQPAILFALDTRQGRYAAITANGWHIYSGEGGFQSIDIQRGLPDPVLSIDPAADLHWFRALLRLDAPDHDTTWQALLDWILRAFQPLDKPDFRDYPILVLTGPPDAGKTVTAKLLIELLDPTMEPLHVMTRSTRALHRLVAKHHVLAFDDTGKVGVLESQSLRQCGLTWQGGIVRPVILTTRGGDNTRDLPEPMIHVELPRVEKPIPQQEIWRQFEGLRPVVLGAILTVLSRNFNTLLLS